MINIEVNDTIAIARLTAMPSKVHRSLRNMADKFTIVLQAYIRGQKLAGQVLKYHTHNLQQSIQRRIEDTETKVTGVVFQNNSLAPYGRIHEEGLTFSRLVTMAWGRKVKEPKSFTFHYPKRSFMISSFQENEAKIVQGIKDAVAEGTKK